MRAAIVALALVAVLGSALHEAFHLLADSGHPDTQCVACQTAHSGGLPRAMPALPIVNVRLEPIVAVQARVGHRPRVHVAHPRGPPPSC